MNKQDIEVSEEMFEILSKIFLLIGLEMPEKVTSKDLEKVFNRMQVLFRARRDEYIDTKPAKVPESFAIIGDKIRPPKKIKNALVISGTGIIRYQLKAMLSNGKINVATLEDQYRGLAEYVKRLHELVIVDFLGNVNEIHDIVREIGRIAIANAVDTKIIVLIPPDQKEFIDTMTLKGVDKVYIKEGNWYELLAFGLKINDTGNTRV